MIRILLGLFLLCLAVLVGALVYLPWWGFLLSLLGVFFGLLGSANLLMGRLGILLVSLPFRAKGAVLRKAKAEVHAVEAAAAPTRTDDPADGPCDFYTVDVTISPRPKLGPFKFWEPGELGLLPASVKVSAMESAPERVGVSGVEVFQNGRFLPDEGMKYFGPQRLRLLVSAKRGAERRQRFLYYFEAFGIVTLPVLADDAKGREGRGGRAAESTRP